MNRLIENKIILIPLLSGFFFFWINIKPSDAEPGIYVNKEPYFTIKYPKDWIPGVKYKNTVLSVVSRCMSPNLIVSVSGVEYYWQLKTAPEVWMIFLRMTFPKTTNHEILSRELITYGDGNSAVKAMISWQWEDGNKLVTSFLAVNREKHRITVSSTGFEKISFNELEKITHSLSFTKE